MTTCVSLNHQRVQIFIGALKGAIVALSIATSFAHQFGCSKHVVLLFQSGCAALYLAAMEGQMEIVNLLADHGANIHELGGDDQITPLMVSIENNHLETASTLVQRGANIHTKDIVCLCVSELSEFSSQIFREIGKQFITQYATVAQTRSLIWLILE